MNDGVRRARRSGRLGRTALLAGAFAMVLAACGAVDDQPGTDPEPEAEEETEEEAAAEPEDDAADALADFPPEEMTLIIPASAGGGSDSNARAIGTHLERVLGTRIDMENHPGAGNTIGAQLALQREQDCSTFLIVNVPHLLFGYMTQDVDFTYDDWAPLAQISVDPGVIRVANDAPWETFEELVEDARANPGSFRASVGNMNSNNGVALRDIAEATGVDWIVVPAEGGPESRLMVVGGQVEFTHAGVFNSLHVEDETRVLAVHWDENLWPEFTDNAPTINEALGTNLEENWSASGFHAPAGCAEDYPERYEFLADKIMETLEDEEFLADMEQLGEKPKLQPLGPEEFGARIQSMIVEVERAVAENG